MPDPDAAWNRAPERGEGRWRRFSASLPMRTALLAVSTVWILGCVWSYQEQSAFAASKGFTYPHLLPLVIDGFAVSMAGVAWAASLDARPAIPARLATIIAVAASSASNGAWAYLRAHHDITTVILGITVPIAANLAFEVLLAELRRQVQRRRGLPPPVAIPYPRLIRITLAPFNTFRTWRTLVLDLTALEHTTTHHNHQPETAIPGTTVTQLNAPSVAAAASRSGPSREFEPQALAPAGADTHRGYPVADQPAPTNGAWSTDPSARANGRATERADALADPRADDLAEQHADAPADQRADDLADDLADERAERGEEQRQDRRSVDPRVLRLARYLIDAPDADEVTGEMVGGLLGIEVAPRTGRRLLGQARDLVHAEAGRRTLELSAPGR
jgi:uncharacterized protein DUF2637